jgi:hypothetical protein
MLILALSDGVQISLAVFQLAFSAIVSLSIWKLTVKHRKTEGMEASLSELTAKLVEERFRGISHQVANDVNHFSKTLQSLSEHIKEQEKNVDGLSDQDRKNELSFNARFDQIKDWLRENVATKQDFEKHEVKADRKFEIVGREIGQLSKEVAVLAEKVRE